MNTNDHAIIVGVKTYLHEDMNHLEGTHNDAMDFIEWLCSDDGGGFEGSVNDVDTSKSIFFIRDNYKAEELETLDAFDAKPSREEIKIAFDKLNRVAAKARNYRKDYQLDDEDIKYYRDPEDGKRYYGKRLYLFFAGHGYNDEDVKRSISLLAANGDYNDLLSNSVDAFNCMEFYEKSGYFKEVILITDCCRIPKPTKFSSKILTPDPANPPRDVRAAWMISCQDGQEAREKEFEGRYNGIFTKVLLESFRSAQTRQGTDYVSVMEISNYVKSNREKFLGEQRPTVHGNPEGMEMKIIVRSNDADGTFSVKFIFPGKWIGGKVTISDLGNSELDSKTVQNAEETLKLPIGVFRLSLEKGNETKKDLVEVVSPDHAMIDLTQKWSN